MDGGNAENAGAFFGRPISMRSMRNCKLHPTTQRMEMGHLLPMGEGNSVYRS
jgi:hypothetical protein